MFGKEQCMIKNIKICSICGKRIPKYCDGKEYITIGRKPKEKIICSREFGGEYSSINNIYQEICGFGEYEYYKVKRYVNKFTKT